MTHLKSLQDWKGDLYILQEKPYIAQSKTHRIKIECEHGDPTKPIQLLRALPIMEVKGITCIYCDKENKLYIKSNNPKHFKEAIRKDDPIKEFVFKVEMEPLFNPEKYHWAKLRFGRYKNKSLWEIYKKDPTYVTHFLPGKTRILPKLHRDFLILHQLIGLEVGYSLKYREGKGETL